MHIYLPHEFVILQILGDSWAVPVAGAVLLMLLMAILPLAKDGRPFITELGLDPATSSGTEFGTPRSPPSISLSCLAETLSRRPALKRSRVSDFEGICSDDEPAGQDNFPRHRARVQHIETVTSTYGNETESPFELLSD